MGRYDNLNKIKQLDPLRDHSRIYHLMVGYEFPWDTVRSLEIALYRTYCVPSISALLDKTGEFRLRTQKRYDDTALIVSEISKNGYDSPRGLEAIQRMNRIHGHYKALISNDDFLYVLSTFVFEPIRWMERFGWRKMCEQERLASFYFWREVGRRMNIKNIPDSYAEFEQFNRAYERENFHYADSNRWVGEATRNLFMSWFPALLRPFVKIGVYAMLDDAMLDAFGFPHPPQFLKTLVAAGLKARGIALKFFPSRSKAGFITDSPQRTYPNGYKISDFGPPAFERWLPSDEKSQ